MIYMSRPRTMGAGLAGSMTKKVNVNQVQFGDKLQGLAPQATHFFIAGNGKAGWNNYRTRADGDRRNFVFCMNQLGGVGRAKSQFKIDGVNQPDGAQRCMPHPYSIAEQIKTLLDYLRNRFPNYQLAFVEGDASRAELARMMALDLSKINVGSSNMKGLIELVNEQNAHGYLLVAISKDTGYVPKGTYLGLPVYIWTTFGGGNFDVWDGTGDPPTDMNPILTATQCITAAAMNNVEYAGVMDMDSRPHGCWYQPPGDDGTTKAAMYWNAASAATGACCADGVKNSSGEVCCPSSCGTCGGDDCGDQTGGADCCVGPIKNSGVTCVNGDDVACIIPADNTCSAGTSGSSACTSDYQCVYQGVRAPYGEYAPGGSTGWPSLTGGALGGPDTDGFPLGCALNFYIEPQVSGIGADDCEGGASPGDELKYRLLDGKGNVLDWDKSDLRVARVYNLQILRAVPTEAPATPQCAPAVPADGGAACWWTVKDASGTADHLDIKWDIDQYHDDEQLMAGSSDPGTYACPSAEGVPCSGAWGPSVVPSKFCNCGACETASAPCCVAGVMSGDEKTCCAKNCTACFGGEGCEDAGDKCCTGKIKDSGDVCANENDVACIIPDDALCTTTDPDCPGTSGSSLYCSQWADEDVWVGASGCPQCPSCKQQTQKWCAYGMAGPAGNNSAYLGSSVPRLIYANPSTDGFMGPIDYGNNDDGFETLEGWNGLVVAYYYAYDDSNDEDPEAGRKPTIFYANAYYDTTGVLRTDTSVSDDVSLPPQRPPPAIGPAWEGDPGNLTAPTKCVSGRVTKATVEGTTNFSSSKLFFCLS